MFQFNINLIVTGFVVFLSGCVSWPPEGHGGMAEHHLETIPTAIPGQPLGPEHGLFFELELVRRHLDVLVLEGAELCFPATVVQAKRQQNRITRELYGDLEIDAYNDLIVHRKLLARLERQLDYVRQQDVCVLPILPITAGQGKPDDIGMRIHDLLNSDNQFAFDSTELNPKYVIRLAQATQLLIKHPDYQLRITGHADMLGGQQHNQKLSLDRARKVGRYLQIMGLAPGRFQIDAQGSDEPLFDSKEPHVRLVNRRVSIELIEKAGVTRTIVE